MLYLQITLALLALLCCFLGFFRIQFSEGPQLDWTSLALALMMLIWLVGVLLLH